MRTEGRPFCRVCFGVAEKAGFMTKSVSWRANEKDGEGEGVGDVVKAASWWDVVGR